MSKQEPIGLLIGAARRRIKQAVGRRLGRWRLTPQQFWVLVAVSENEGLSLGDLVERLRMDAPTASRVVTALVARKLLRAAGDPHDRRRSRLHPTAAGAALGPELRALAAEIRQTVARGFDEAELEAARAMLRRVIANMDLLERRADRPRRRRI